MSMSEYRRFIAYFYEYIDGRKQQNAGFVKVELRNGLWRFFLRLTVEVCPAPPIQVYGLVREREQLLGLPLGTIRSVRQVAEEWAFRDDATIGEGGRKPEELSGIRIESGDGRCFITVWDGEEVDAGKLLTEAEALKAEAEEEEAGEGMPAEDPSEAETEAAEEEATKEETAEELPADDTDEAEFEAAEVETEEVIEEEAPASDEGEDTAGEDGPDSDIVEQPADGKEDVEAEENETEECGAEESAAFDMPEQRSAVLEELFQKRAAFQPFADARVESCVMILPCDIARLQQENWQVGRSSFLQHGFYLYRHLLLGRVGDGTYILGVPGIDNPQEEYMAQMFGFEQFRKSVRRDGGQTFGYWCRELRKI